MPIVPRATRKVEDSTLPRARLSTSVPAGAFGGLDKTFGEAERIAVNAYKEEKQRFDESRLVEERTAFFTEFEYPKIYDPKAGAITRRGKNAVGISDELSAGIDEYATKRMQGLGNDDQKAAFQKFVEARKGSIRDWALRHETAQGDVFRQETRKAGKEVSKERASIDPGNAGLEVAYLRMEVSKQAQEEGWDEMVTAQELQKEETDLHSRVIKSMLVNNATGAQEYYKKNEALIDPDTRSELIPKIQQAGKDVEATKISGAIWTTNGPKDDNSPVNIDLMEEEARKASSDPDVAKATITGLRERASAHRDASKERTTAKKDVVWAAYNKGLPSKQIYTLPEFQALSGSDQREVRDKFDSYAKAALREETADLKIEQESNRMLLTYNLPLLRQTDLEHMHNNRELSSLGYRSLVALKDPKSSPVALAAFKHLDDSRTKGLFNTTDKNDNEKQWVEFTRMLHSYMENNPDGDPAAFVEEIMKPVKAGFVGNIVDKFRYGTPALDTAQRERQAVLQTMAGGAGKPTNTSYQVNEVYTDAQGRKAKYLGEGKWQKVK